MSRRKSTKKLRKRRQMNGKKAVRTDRGRVKRMGIGGGWA
jgi:hypothetical protein